MEESGEDNSGGNADTFKEVLFSHLRRITNVATVEMRGGYYTIMVTKAGGEKDIYVPDTREIYCNGVLCLAHISIHKFDKKMIERWKSFKEILATLEKKFVDQSSIDEEVILGEGYYKDPKDQILLEQYRIKKLRLFQSLFLSLNRLFGRKNWMEIENAEFWLEW